MALMPWDFCFISIPASHQPYGSFMDINVVFPYLSNGVAFITYLCCRQTHDLKQKVLYRILAIMLLGVFAFNTTPRAFIHQFFEHHDTDDDAPGIVKHGTTLSVKHVHCGFLQIDPEPYEPTSMFYYVLVKEVTWHFPPPVIPVIKHIPYRTLSPRAPPAASFV